MRCASPRVVGKLKAGVEGERKYVSYNSKTYLSVLQYQSNQVIVQAGAAISYF